jgi:hypothetical protein
MHACDMLGCNAPSRLLVGAVLCGALFACELWFPHCVLCCRCSCNHAPFSCATGSQPTRLGQFCYAKPRASRWLELLCFPILRLRQCCIIQSWDPLQPCRAKAGGKQSTKDATGKYARCCHLQGLLSAVQCLLQEVGLSSSPSRNLFHTIATLCHLQGQGRRQAVHKRRHRQVCSLSRQQAAPIQRSSSATGHHSAAQRVVTLAVCSTAHLPVCAGIKQQSDVCCSSRCWALGWG